MLRSLVAMAMIGVFMAFALRIPSASMLLYWWFGIFKPHDWMWWDVSSLRLPLAAALLFGFQAWRTRHTPRLDDPVAVLMVVLVALMTVSTVTAGCDAFKIVSLPYMLVLVTMVLMSERFLSGNAAIFALVLTVVLSLGFFSSKAGINAALSGASLYGTKTEGGSFADSNGMALASAMMLLLLLFAVQALRDSDAAQELPRVFSGGSFAWAAWACSPSSAAAPPGSSSPPTRAVRRWRSRSAG